MGLSVWSASSIPDLLMQLPTGRHQNPESSGVSKTTKQQQNTSVSGCPCPSSLEG